MNEQRKLKCIKKWNRIFRIIADRIHRLKSCKNHKLELVVGIPTCIHRNRYSYHWVFCVLLAYEVKENEDEED